MYTGSGSETLATKVRSLARLVVLTAILFALPLQAQDLPLIKIIATGGTIAHLSATPEEAARGGGQSGARLSIADRIKGLRQLHEYARVEVEEFSRVASGDITVPMLVGISNRINKVFSTEPKVAGVVVTIGSNTMEELAYFLHLTVKNDKPVVLTAAQRLVDTPSSDGDMNLIEAVRVAALPEAKGKGALVVVNDEIQSARDARKTISHRLEAWNSGDMGDLGLIDGDRVTFYRLATKRHTTRSEFDVTGLTDLPKVYIAYSSVGADGIGAKYAVSEGKAKGIVAAAFPTGGVAPELERTLHEMVKKGIPVVDSHRGGRGRPEKRYPDFIDADTLIPQHARILLMLALTKTSDPDEIQRMFYEY